MGLAADVVSAMQDSAFISLSFEELIVLCGFIVGYFIVHCSDVGNWVMSVLI